MIVAATPAASAFTFAECLAQPGAAELARRLRVVTYESIFAQPELPVGSYLFTAVDQLTPAGRRIIGGGRDALARAAPDAVLLNDPMHTLRRYRLLRTAFDHGTNRFRATRASTAAWRLRFPVFVRSEREHTGSLTPLIQSRRALLLHLLRLSRRGYRLRDLLVVEYCETADPDGIYRKYSAFIVGDQIIPRCVNHTRHWVTKDDDRIITEQTAREDLDYVTGNPHEEWLRDIFRMARVGYGRVDYGLLDGTPQLWEINTCPTIGGPPGGTPNSRRTPVERQLLAPGREHFYRRFFAAMQGLDRLDEQPPRTVRLPISPPDAAALRSELRVRARVDVRRAGLARVLAPLARTVKRRLRGQARPPEPQRSTSTESP